MKIKHHKIDVNGIGVFYRETGPQDAPTLLLLHGFPSSSHMFRDLLPLLADKYHLVAPDLPGFGQTDLPGREKFTYSFAHLAEVIGQFTTAIGLQKFAIYIFDYGAPTGLRIALQHPERITAIISQNGNAYEEGLSADGWNPIRAYWRDKSPANRETLRALLQPETTLFQYTHGVPDPSLVSPDGRSLDDFYLSRPGAAEAQLDLFGDYVTNVALYPQFQAYFRKYQPPFLAVWGSHDPFFLPAGAEAYRRDLPKAEVQFFDTGHFALETHLRRNRRGHPAISRASPVLRDCEISKGVGGHSVSTASVWPCAIDGGGCAGFPVSEHHRPGERVFPAWDFFSPRRWES